MIFPPYIGFCILILPSSKPTPIASDTMGDLNRAASLGKKSFPVMVDAPIIIRGLYFLITLSKTAAQVSHRYSLSFSLSTTIILSAKPFNERTASLSWYPINTPYTCEKRLSAISFPFDNNSNEAFRTALSLHST